MSRSHLPAARSLLLSLVLFAASALPAPAADITVRLDKPGPAVSPTLYGVFFEDINRAGDGGLYAEMVQNRSFEDSFEPIHWTTVSTGGAAGTVAIDNAQPLNPRNLTHLKMEVTALGTGRFGIMNQGFKGVPLQGKIPNEAALRAWNTRSQAAAGRSTQGMNVAQGKRYNLSFYARAQGVQSVTASLEQPDGTVLARQTISGIGGDWKKFTAAFTAAASHADARLVLSADTPGTLWLDMVSLFPQDTFKNRPNGLRPDLVARMQEMNPGLLRFPGGSFSEGHLLEHAWRWKETLGDVAQRKSNWNIWGYRSTNGLGFHEYLQLAEDLGAEPLYVAHVGMAERDFVPMDQLEPWIQDVLDAIEYANGPVTSKWGALRAQAGHPEPFNLKYVEIGNENGMGYSWGGGTRADYLPRYKAFYERVKAAYPNIVAIANIHTEPDVPTDVVDEHYYEPAEWFFKNASLYDRYDRSKPRVYVGEYAAKPDGGNGNLRAALAEAAFLTGVERNADVVTMTSYAPLFTNPPWQRWQPNAIAFNNHTSYATPSWHVQVLYGRNRPDTIVQVDLPPAAPPAPATAPAAPTLFASAGLQKESGDLILKVVNSARQPLTADVRLTGASLPFASIKATELSAPNLTDENSFASPDKISPKTTDLPATLPHFSHTFPAQSLTVLRWSKK